MSVMKLKSNFLRYDKEFFGELLANLHMQGYCYNIEKGVGNDPKKIFAHFVAFAEYKTELHEKSFEEAFYDYMMEQTSTGKCIKLVLSKL